MSQYTATIKIPHDQLTYWNRCLMDEAFREEEEFSDKETAAAWTAHFPDGCFADVKVCPASDGIYSECVLFDKEGRQLAFTEPCYDSELDGHWELTAGGKNYLVVVEEGEEA